MKGWRAEAVNKESGELSCSQRLWFEQSHGNLVVMSGYTVFKKDEQGRRGARIALCVRSSFTAQSLCMNVEMYY